MRSNILVGLTSNSSVSIEQTSIRVYDLWSVATHMLSNYALDEILPKKHKYPDSK